VFRVNDDVEVIARNIYVAAALYAQGIKLISAVATQRRSAEFIFANENGAGEEAIRNYFERTTVLPARDLFEALQQLKKEATSATRPA
jgi:hypothetical protein